MIHPTLWCQFFPLLPKANRCSLDLPHLVGITVESSWKFPIQEPLHWALCTWAQLSQSSPAWPGLDSCCCRSTALSGQDLLPRALVPHYGNATAPALRWCCCGRVVKSRYSSRIVPFSRKISTPQQ